MSSKPLNYLTIGKTGQHELIIKKSKFICSLARTETVEEAQKFIEQVSKKYHDATHNTYAYTLGLNDNQVKASDNGEPSGTAGIPELKALQLMKLKNVTAVVTRYFGGIKLGAGGLIRAYAGSVANALKEIGIVEVKEQDGLKLTLSYPQYQIFSNFLQAENLQEFDTEFLENVTTHIYLDPENVQEVSDRLVEFYQGKVSFEKSGSKIVEVAL